MVKSSVGMQHEDPQKYCPEESLNEKIWLD